MNLTVSHLTDQQKSTEHFGRYVKKFWDSSGWFILFLLTEFIRDLAV